MDDAQLNYKLLTIRLRVDCLVQNYNRLVRDTDRPGMVVKIGTKRKKAKPLADTEAGNLAEVIRPRTDGKVTS